MNTNIQTPGDYKESKVDIPAGENIYFFDSTPQITEFHVGENATLHYFSFFEAGETPYEKNFYSTGENAQIHIHSV